MNKIEKDISDARVAWTEDRFNDGVYRVIAERNGCHWEFWEQEAWEVTWHRMPQDDSRTKKADQLIWQRYLKMSVAGSPGASRPSYEHVGNGSGLREG